MQQPPPQPPAQLTPQQYGGPPGQPQQTNGLAIAALISGILGLTIFFGLGSVLALIFGYIARGQIKRSQGQQGGNGMAIAGLVMGWIGVVVSLVFVVLLILGAVTFFNFTQSPEFREALEEGVDFVVEGSLEQVTEAEAGCTGIESYPDMGQEHVKPGQQHEPYNSNPPTSGPHYGLTADPGFYPPDTVVAPELIVHNLEHGQVVIWYRPYVDEFFEEQIERLVAQEPNHTVAVPWEDMNEPYNLVVTSWTKARACEQASQEVIDDFRRQFQGVAPEPLTPPFKG